MKKKDNCNGCHLCCEYFLITLTDVPDDALEFFETWGIVVDDQGESKLLKIFSPCQHLTENGCNIYEQRPQHCREWFCAD